MVQILLCFEILWKSLIITLMQNTDYEEYESFIHSFFRSGGEGLNAADGERVVSLALIYIDILRSDRLRALEGLPAAFLIVAFRHDATLDITSVDFSLLGIVRRVKGGFEEDVDLTDHLRGWQMCLDVVATLLPSATGHAFLERIVVPLGYNVIEILYQSPMLIQVPDVIEPELREASLGFGSAGGNSRGCSDGRNESHVEQV